MDIGKFVWLAENPDPGREELVHFIEAVKYFLTDVLEGKEFHFLWEDNENLERMARETFESDVIGGANELIKFVPSIPEDLLTKHGLLGRPLRFKFNVIATISHAWDRVRGNTGVRGWFKRMIDAIDAPLDSLIAVSGGAGAILKEFKDSLSSLAKVAEQ